MNQPVWETIAAHLRAEIEEYGALLAQLDEQQARLIARDTAAVAESTALIERQAALARLRRDRRERAVREAAQAAGRPGDSSLRGLLETFPAEVRPMFEALIEETNRLVRSAGRRLRQNQLVISRLLDVHRQVVPAARPLALTRTYGPAGRVQLSLAGVSSGYHAEG